MKTLLLLIFFLGVLYFWIWYFQPRPILRFLARRSPNVIFFSDTDKKVIALTLDDGPCKNTTPLILDLLKKHKIKATFFLISGRVPGNEKLVTRIVEEGHEIGNHNTRDEPSNRLTEDKFKKQLMESHNVLSKFSPVKYNRPGSGWYTKSMLEQIKLFDYLCVLASVHPYDPQIPSANFAKIHIMINTIPGSILLLHDCLDQGERTLEVLEYVIPKLLNKGYQIGTVSELLKYTASLN